MGTVMWVPTVITDQNPFDLWRVPTAEDLSALFRERPELAVSTFARLQLALAWEPDHSYPAGSGYLRLAVTGQTVATAARDGNQWLATVDTTLDGTRTGNRSTIRAFPESHDWTPTPTEVMAAADRFLTVAGWSLVDGRLEVSP